VGHAIGEHPAWVRHHLKLLEQAGLVEMVETRITSGVSKISTSPGRRPAAPGTDPARNDRAPRRVFSGSHDLAVELLAGKLSNYLDVLTLPVGSLTV